MPLPIASKLLAPFGLIYGAGVNLRNEFYRAGILKTQRINAPVISVGNITTGGTGKTPMVAYIAREIAKQNFQPCILTRGYGRKDERARVVVRDGAKVLADAQTGGDEPLLLAEMLNDTNAVIISDARRVEAANWARREFAKEIEASHSKLVFILDDGFQHRRMARDFDIVMIDATNPFGGERLLPRGRLREPLDSLKRADAVVISRAAHAADLRALRDKLQNLTDGKTPIFNSNFRTRCVRPLNDFALRVGDSSVFRDAEVSEIFNERAALGAFCALGNPTAFFSHLQRDNFKLAYVRAFRDHHRYTQADIDLLAREAAARGAGALLTTAKDAVKLRDLFFPLPLAVVEIELAIDDEKSFGERLRRACRKPARRSGR